MSLFSRRECGHYHRDVEWPPTSACPRAGLEPDVLDEAETAPEEGTA